MGPVVGILARTHKQAEYFAREQGWHRDDWIFADMRSLRGRDRLLIVRGPEWFAAPHEVLDYVEAMRLHRQVVVMMVPA